MKIPPPFLISWNITKRCNLKCAHCYLDASELAGNAELSTEGAKAVIDGIAALNPQSMLILTGGEPLMRDDCLTLSAYAASRGITVVLGTNGTMLDKKTVARMAAAASGVKGVGVSLDSSTPSYHDRFRGIAGSWKKVDSGIDVLREYGVDFNIQLTVMRDNISEIEPVIEYSLKKGARAVNIFFLVCTGRGQDMVDITPGEYETILTRLMDITNVYEKRIMVRARCAPHFLRIVRQKDPQSPLLSATSGCIAGTGYLRITPEGYVTPCPYIPTVAGNLREAGLKEIWEDAEVFKILRDKRYAGRCSACEYSDICGGCRAKALARTSNIMGEDPWCEYEPKGKPSSPLRAVTTTEVVWTEEAEERLSKVPGFLRGMVKKGVERYVREKGLDRVTPEIMSELKKRTGR
ncbi:MAG: radical SAM protein [Deltaproteobacteria bacterium]|nr:radical SAM protein [Deltaproteobacteria bacterium]